MYWPNRCWFRGQNAGGGNELMWVVDVNELLFKVKFENYIYTEIMWRKLRQLCR